MIFRTGISLELVICLQHGTPDMVVDASGGHALIVPGECRAVDRKPFLCDACLSLIVETE